MNSFYSVLDFLLRSNHIVDGKGENCVANQSTDAQEGALNLI